jgi:aquaporin Z
MGTKAGWHWVEYLAEASGLALFMLSAAGFATLLQHPSSPWLLTSDGAFARVPMGLAMGLTAVALVYSPWGRRSGAHMNPAITLTFLRLGKIVPADAGGYVAAQFLGGAAGIALATWMLRGLPGDASVNYVATVPGPSGLAVAFAAEAAISFGMMLIVLVVSNHRQAARWTGVCAGALVCLYIVIEAPLSGMSMNPARSLGPALLAGETASLWIYFTAPLLGMLFAAEVYVRGWGLRQVRCAKLDHPAGVKCPFRCRMGELSATTPRSLVSEVSA